MPRRVPSYRHFKPKNLGLVVIDGRQFYLGRYGSPESVAEYNRLIQEWMAAGSPPQRPGPRRKPAESSTAPTTVDEMILAFWKHAEVHYRAPDGEPTGEADNFREALRPVRRLYGHASAADFGPLALRTVRDEMVKSGLARTTINARINRIRRVFKWAASHEIVPVSVVQGLSTVAGLQQGRTRAPEPEKVKAVPIEDVEATLPHLPSPVAGMVRVQLATGCRAGEVVRMRTCDITMTGSTWEYRPATHKTAWRGCDRVIVLGPKAQAVVRGFLKDDTAAYLFDPRDAVRERYERQAANDLLLAVEVEASCARPLIPRETRRARRRGRSRASTIWSGATSTRSPELVGGPV